MQGCICAAIRRNASGRERYRNRTQVYYDENIQPSDPETAAYYVTVTDQPEETAAGTLHTGIITAHTIDGTEIYTLNVAAYLPGEG